jgi:uncharacterized phage protein (TIGR02218 family)
MRHVPSALQAKLDAGVTTLCQCWRLTRRDGVVLGFTDHDRDLVFDATTFRAGAGFAASEATSRFGLSVGGGEIFGALDDEALTEADLAAGRYDAARVECWLVDWSDPALRILQAVNTLGEVRREGRAFSAELRGPADALAQERGRVYAAPCNADLGDARCGVDLHAPGLHGFGAVVSLAAASAFKASGLSSFADGFFTAGRLTWTSGANAGLAMDVKDHRAEDGAARLALWQAAPEPVAAGDVFAIAAGCDKRFATCRDRFANAVNFRGFPHIPGNDFVMSYPVAGEPGHTGDLLRE